MRLPLAAESLHDIGPTKSCFSINATISTVFSMFPPNNHRVNTDRWINCFSMWGKHVCLGTSTTSSHKRTSLFQPFLWQVYLHPYASTPRGTVYMCLSEILSPAVCAFWLEFPVFVCLRWSCIHRWDHAGSPVESKLIVPHQMRGLDQDRKTGSRTLRPSTTGVFQKNQKKQQPVWQRLLGALALPDHSPPARPLASALMWAGVGGMEPQLN